MKTNLDAPVKIDLAKLVDLYSPYNSIPWNIDSPITKDEIKRQLRDNNFTDPNYNPHDLNTTKEGHISRIVWLINNWSNQHPIDLDFGVPSLGCGFCIYDGVHRLAAALYMNKPFIYANTCGQIDIIEKYLFKE